MGNKIVTISEMMEISITKSRQLKEAILKSEWEKIVGDLSKKSHVIFLKQGKLFVGVENSIWIQHMNFQKKNIIKKINTFLGGDYIKELIFKIGKKTPNEYFLEEKEKESIHIDLDNITLSPDEYLDIDKELENLEDIEIKERTKKIIEKSYKRKKYLNLHGYKRCDCGAYFKSENSKCAVCMNKDVLELEEILMRAFVNHEMLKYEDAKKEIPTLIEKEYKRIKLKKLSKIKKNIDIYIREKNNNLAFDLAKHYFMIDLGQSDDDYIEKKAMEFIEILKNKK
ncbi:MAG: DUF721 domain-containing protein [Psychrilyobacter sp.]|nr:DUF721 domain-containing protein [Psychrilyobacter sp.]